VAEFTVICIAVPLNARCVEMDFREPSWSKEAEVR